jgi:NAD(P)-dependent dehydrogenase (short-subunit alcohol dehydrogenase family)
MNELTNKTALITGASRGIGRAAALMLARAGAHVIAIARTVGGLEELDDAIRAEGGSATLTPLDMRDYPGIYRLTPALNERFGKLDIVVGNAAIAGVPSPLDHIEPKAWDDTLAINVTANWHLIRASDPLLKRSDAGRAVFISSGVASSAHAYWAPYSVSKAALDVLARTYAAETSTTAVRVNLFSPGATRTRMRAMAMPGEDPMKLPTPEDVVERLLDLCLPSFNETGKLYDFPSGKLLEFRRPA